MGSRQIAASVGTVLLVVLITTAFAPERDSTSRTCSVVLESEVCTWVVMEGETAVELGATVPLEIIEAAPADAEMVWPPKELVTVALPEEARVALGIDHMGINWEAHGHPPATFAVPHFDFHFYNITQDEVGTIDCSNDAKPGQLPAGYTLPDVDVPGLGVLVGLCVPRMGMHAMVDHDAHATDAFEASMILGYYAGQAIFFEPMVSRELLMKRSDFSLSVPAIDDLPPGVHYPREFRAEYDGAGRQYRLVFAGFPS